MTHTPGKTCLKSGIACHCTYDISKTCKGKNAKFRATDNNGPLINKGGAPLTFTKGLFTEVSLGAAPGAKAAKVTTASATSGNSLPEDDAVRGQYPMADGCLDYFPNALAEVSRISFEGNQKHNPGQKMNWARGKSTDHRNKIIRHTVDSLPETEVAIEHAAQAAWRALAHLQEKIEHVRGVRMSGASTAA